MHAYLLKIQRGGTNATRQTSTPIPRGHRLVQVPVSRATRADFAEVPQVLPDAELDTAIQSFDRMYIAADEFSFGVRTDGVSGV